MRSVDRLGAASGYQHDLTAGMTPREILIGLAYIGQMIDFGDRDLQTTCVDQAGKFYEHLGIRRRAVALGLDAVFRGRREIDDRIDPIGRDTEFERQIHIAAAERVDEGIDFASGCGSDPIRDAFPISDWDHTVVSKPGMVCCAGETDDVSSAEILANWTAMEPTPPAAPEMTTVSSAFNEMACTAA